VEAVDRGRTTVRYAAQFGKELLAIGAEALAVLECYSWPGNLRELDNVMP
jgi:transcriptional regulator with PAS, ATPase and Fis domain